MSRTYDDPDAETDFEREERMVERELDRRDRLEDYAPLPDTEPNPETAALGRLVEREDVLHLDRLSGKRHGPFFAVESAETVAVLPRDIEEWPAAQARVEQLATDYARVEIDRLPPMGAHHWLVLGHKAGGGVDSFRVGAQGSLMPWPVKP